MSPRTPTALRPTRRAVIAAAAPVAAAAVLSPRIVVAAETPGQEMLARTTALLAKLEPAGRSAATFDFDGRRRRAWNFMLGSRKAPGVALEDMSEHQKVATLDLVRSGLGEEGFLKAERIMLQQDIMRDEWGKGSPDRNRERFSIQIFGTPSADAPWGWRFEGHHLSITFTLVGTEVVSVTPSAFSSEPNPVPSGPHKGLVVLQEENLGRAIFGDLSPENRRRALISERSLGNITTTAGREDRFGERQGIPLADLPASQAEDITRLIDVFASDNYVPALRTREADRARSGDLMSARFGWAGDDRGEGSIYYRIHGDTFVIEFATLRGQPLHHHAVRHDLERNFGNHRNL